MKEITLEKADEIHKVLKKYRKSGKYKFRGQSDKSWSLIPKAGRIQFQNVRDEELFRNWRRRAIIHLNSSNYDTWEYLAIAQHTGLPTRLLDWTHNPLTAVFFAANENLDFDGAVYVVKPNHYFVPEDTDGPFSIQKIKFFLFNHLPLHTE